jgi:hypothetical protein
MLIRWNSTYKMLSIAYSQEAPITAVCTTQQIDISVRDIMLTPQDWELLQEIIDLFEIFVHPSRKLQGSTYPTLNYTIPQYYMMIKKLKEKRQVWGDSSIGLARKVALEKLNESYNYFGAHPHAGIATICDPRFNYGVFNRSLPEWTGNAKKAKIMSNFKNCFIKYEDQKQAIRAARVLKEASERPKDSGNGTQDDLSDA